MATLEKLKKAGFAMQSNHGGYFIIKENALSFADGYVATVADVDIYSLKTCSDRHCDVDALLLEKIASGYDDGVGNVWQIDDASQVAISLRKSIAESSIAYPSEVPWSSYNTWRNLDNTDIEFSTAHDFISFAIDAYNHGDDLKRVAFGHKDALDALTDPQEINDYDITTGW